MLDVTFEADSLGFGLAMCRDRSWKETKERVLIIQQTVTAEDLNAKRLASTPALVNCIKHARQIARGITPKLHDFAFATINFQDSKHLHMRGQARYAAEAKFKERVQGLIDKLKPTRILISGDINLMYPEIQHGTDKNGWVHKLDGRLVVSTLDFGRLLEKDGKLANCLGFFCRHLAHLLVGYHPYSIRGLRNKPIYVNTIAKFDRMMELFKDAKEVGFDTEDRNLSVYHNKLYTGQFCFDKYPNQGFVVPIDHPKTPFTREEINYIKRSLRKQFQRDDFMFLTFNGKFDLRVIRACLKLRIIRTPVWEITAGEHLLDENVSSLPSLGIKQGNLRAVMCSYDNDHYYQAEFGKEERGNIGSHAPDDPKVLEYESMDAVCLHAIKAKQIERASRMEIEGKNYKPYFINHMIHQMSDTEHQLSHLKQDGSYISKKYLKSLMREDSPLKKEIDNILQNFYLLPAVQEANKQLLEASGFKAGSLFGSANSPAKTQWIFNLNKSDHKQLLFLGILGLQPISKTKSGAPAIDKSFIAHYKDQNHVVAQYGVYQQAAKLMSTYVRGWYKKLITDIDSAADSHLRPEYSYYDVDTGRLASKNPNLQNIPARSKLAKIIKRMFETEPGSLLIRFDYSAHEVRGWSIVSGDLELASAFRAGQKLRQEWIQNPTDELKNKIKLEGDLHLLNVKRFFNKIVEKSHPLRDAVKSVVFGVIYGKGAKTLGEDTKKAEIDALRAEQNKLYTELRSGNKKVQGQIDEVDYKLARLLEEDRSEYAQTIIDKLFNEFKKGHRWIKRMGELAEEKFYVYSPIGRIRHLYAAVTGDRKVVARQVRRGTNAPIQGFASEIGVKAARRVMMSFYELAPKLLPMLGLEDDYDYTVKSSRVVHDALYFSVPFEMVIPFIHVLQYEATYGITQAYEDEFNVKFTIEPEIEIEVAARDDQSYKWGWDLPGLSGIVNSALVDMEALGKFREGESVKSINKTIFNAWRRPKVRAMLQEHYPLLGVKNLDAQIKKTAADVYSG